MSDGNDPSTPEFIRYVVVVHGIGEQEERFFLAKIELRRRGEGDTFSYEEYSGS